MKFTKGLITGILLTVLLLYLYNKNGKGKIALPDLKINEGNSNVADISADKKELPEKTENKIESKKYPEKTYITFNQKSEDLREFEKNINEIAGIRMFAETGTADAYFFRVLADISKGMQDVFFIEDKRISEDFIKDFNIFYNRLQNRKYYKNNPQKEDIKGIKKGDKAKEVNMLKNVINRLWNGGFYVVNAYSDNMLKEDGNYNKKLYSITKDILSGTSVFDAENEGIVSNKFIRNIYNLINNLKN